MPCERSHLGAAAAAAAATCVLMNTSDENFSPFIFSFRGCGEKMPVSFEANSSSCASIAKDHLLFFLCISWLYGTRVAPGKLSSKISAEIHQSRASMKYDGPLLIDQPCLQRGFSARSSASVSASTVRASCRATPRSSSRVFPRCTTVLARAHAGIKMHRANSRYMCSSSSRRAARELCARPVHHRMCTRSALARARAARGYLYTFVKTTIVQYCKCTWEAFRCTSIARRIKEMFKDNESGASVKIKQNYESLFNNAFDLVSISRRRIRIMFTYMLVRQNTADAALYQTRSQARPEQRQAAQLPSAFLAPRRDGRQSTQGQRRRQGGAAPIDRHLLGPRRRQAQRRLPRAARKVAGPQAGGRTHALFAGFQSAEARPRAGHRPRRSGFGGGQPRQLHGGPRGPRGRRFRVLRTEPGRLQDRVPPALPLRYGLPAARGQAGRRSVADSLQPSGDQRASATSSRELMKPVEPRSRARSRWHPAFQLGRSS
ncbi:unnamed protein product [Trichogramma brassicae]|uniref:Uncharacterized protein n=1 Tax=Trichogramma brassicae TaxID=86971 RepID=A0A6H5IXH7_9HYME|nr:unnamed protein product [Trichogramma brassicae]